MSKRLNLGYAKKVLGEKLIEQVLSYIEGNPETNIPRFLRVIELIARAPGHKESIQNTRKAYENVGMIKPQPWRINLLGWDTSKGGAQARAAVY